ncbi:hypothetical protein [Bacillus pinisoli]|uniref:hypothetical protein n=1 Tax=Bacillus pinisoli TaxID=2901866 RepID=UPI001FF4CE09|nr:hypothetical protein [Bacillus pinisoli]
MRIVVSLLCLLLLSSTGLHAYAADYTNSQLFKVTIWQNNEETEFEFENPSHYEWEKGEKVVKGEAAQEQVKKVFRTLSLSKDVKVDEVKQRLANFGYTEIDRFVVRWMNNEGKLYTWHWERE